MKIHLKRNSRETWCGRKLKGLQITDRTYEANCAVCVKADMVEQQRNTADGATVAVPKPRSVPLNWKG